MPFEEKDPKDYAPKVGLKKQATGQKSMFEGRPKPPTQQEFRKQVEKVQEIKSDRQVRAAELYFALKKVLTDKTLPQNRNVLNIESEREVLQNVIDLAIEINNDPNEKEGMGSLACITYLLKLSLVQRDKINELEYAVDTFQKKLDSSTLADYINKEIAKALDKKKVSE